MTLFTNTGVEESCGMLSGSEYNITIGEGTEICCAEGYEMMWWGIAGRLGGIIDAIQFQFQCG